MEFPIHPMELPVLDPPSRLRLLETLVGQERTEADPEAARQICEWVGYLPLGIELIGRYLVFKKAWSLGRTLQELKEKRLDQLKRDPQEPMTAERGVRGAFELSWEELDPIGRWLACAMSVFALSPFEWDVVVRLEDHDRSQLEVARDQLLRLHLIEEKTEDWFQLHQLIREFLQEKLQAAEDQAEIKRRFAEELGKIEIRDDYTLTRNEIERSTPWVPHFEEAIDHLTQYSEEYYCRALQILLKAVGLEHPNTQTGIENHSHLLRTVLTEDPTLAEHGLTHGSDLTKDRLRQLMVGDDQQL